MKNFTFKSYLFLVCVLTVISSACKKENAEDIVSSNSQSEEVVPFFELSKGDTLPKGLYREKPKSTGNYEVIFTTESKMKAAGASSGSGYITDLFVSTRKGNNVPNTLGGGIKIPVDLNEGAGGNYIYLFYKKGLQNAIYDLKVAMDDFSAESYLQTAGNADVVRYYYNNGWADLNDGAGGYYIYLISYKNTFNLHNTPIRDIAIISSNSEGVTLSGWTKVPGDLNKGVGGKWIFVFYKR